jgi:hypothetical protein
MKVKIGKYPSRLVCNIHTNHMEKKYGFQWPSKPHSKKLVPPKMLWEYEDYVLEAIEDAIQSVYNVVNWAWLDRRTQTTKVRIDKWDTWSMDHTLAHIVLPMLVQLKESKHGAPYVYPEDVPTELRPTKKELLVYTKKAETDSKWFERWDWAMGEMIWAFEQKCRDNWDEDYYEYREMGPEESKDPDSLFGLKLVWEDREGQAAHQARMTNGFRLFGKYYEHLWD